MRPQLCACAGYWYNSFHYKPDVFLKGYARVTNQKPTKVPFLGKKTSISLGIRLTADLATDYTDHTDLHGFWPQKHTKRHEKEQPLPTHYSPFTTHHSPLTIYQRLSV